MILTWGRPLGSPGTDKVLGTAAGMRGQKSQELKHMRAGIGALDGLKMNVEDPGRHMTVNPQNLRMNNFSQDLQFHDF